MVGYSVGSALSGLAIDSISRASSLLVAVVFAILTLAVSVMTVGITPALGKLDLSTKAIEIVEEQESP